MMIDVAGQRRANNNFFCSLVNSVCTDKGNMYEVSVMRFSISGGCDRRRFSLQRKVDVSRALARDQDQNQDQNQANLRPRSLLLLFSTQLQLPPFPNLIPLIQNPLINKSISHLAPYSNPSTLKPQPSRQYIKYSPHSRNR